MQGGFSTRPPEDAFNVVLPMINDDDNEMLTSVPGDEEIHVAILGLNPSSVPGPDGFTGHFFSHCWHIIKEDLVRAVGAFFLGTPLPSSISSTNFVLLPKKPIIERMDQLRPISLCNFVHKIISSIRNARLRNFLPRLISQEQCGFIPGRNMTDSSIALAHDLTCHINNGYRGGNIIIKIDMSKAYDRVSWIFLLRMFKALGFKDKWLLSLINRFCTNSGQQLNPSKCTIFFDENIPEDRRRTILQATNFTPGVFPTTYLGAPLFPGRVKIAYFQTVEDKIRARIGGWIGNLISMGGKLIIIESILNSLLTHILAALPTPLWR
ncbi:hypothetical protein QQ045_018507 [Rhodiola kirilowii]